jgi:nucleoside-diphosphate-sugar epimerase
LPIVIFRPCGIYGPGDLRFLKLFRSIKKHYFIMLGSGDVLYHMIYIDDLIDGILLCGKKEEAVGNIYILGSDEFVKLKALVSMISNILGVNIPSFSLPFLPVYYLAKTCELVFKPLNINPPIYRRRIDFFRSNRAFDISKKQESWVSSPDGFKDREKNMNGMKQMAYYESQIYIAIYPKRKAGILRGYEYCL